MSKKKPRINLGTPVAPQSGDLEKLFSATNDVEQSSGLLLLALKLDAIQPDPNQPRKTFSQESLEELAESIRQDGVIQPIEVTEIRANQYMIVHGERRWQAARMAGLEAIPAVVRRRNYDDTTRFVRQLVENIQREDLNDVDRAYGMVRLRDLMQAELDAQVAEGLVAGKPHARSVSWAKVSERLGFTRQRASQLIQLLDLPEEVKDAVRAGTLSERDTRILRGLRPSQQRALLRALEAGDVDQRQYRQVARFLKNEAPDLTVHEALRILEKPLPPLRAISEPSFGTPFMDDASSEEVSSEAGGDFDLDVENLTAVADLADPPAPQQTAVGGRISSVQRLIWARGHLARVSRQGLPHGERTEVVRLLHVIAQEVASLLAALEEREAGSRKRET